MFRFISEDLKIELVYRFLEFLGVNELPNRQCSNDVYRQQRIQNLEETGKNFGVTEFKIKEELFQILVSKKSWSTDKQIKEPSLVNFIRYTFLFWKVLIIEMCFNRVPKCSQTISIWCLLTCRLSRFTVLKRPEKWPKIC